MQQKYIDNKTGRDSAKPTNGPNVKALLSKIGAVSQPKAPPKPRPHTPAANKFLAEGAPRSYDGQCMDGINIKPSHKGMLHEDLGVPQGQPIPAGKLASAKNSSDPAERKRATFAANAKKWNHG